MFIATVICVDLVHLLPVAADRFWLSRDVFELREEPFSDISFVCGAPRTGMQRGRRSDLRALY